MNDIRFRMVDLTEMEANELADLLDSPVDQRALKGSRHGELTTVTLIVVLSQPVLQALSLWIFQRRRKSIAKYRFERELPDGTWERLTVAIKFTENSSPESVTKQIIEQLLTAPPEVNN